MLLFEAEEAEEMVFACARFFAKKETGSSCVFTTELFVSNGFVRLWLFAIWKRKKFNKKLFLIYIYFNFYFYFESHFVESGYDHFLFSLRSFFRFFPHRLHNTCPHHDDEWWRHQKRWYLLEVFGVRRLFRALGFVTSESDPHARAKNTKVRGREKKFSSKKFKKIQKVKTFLWKLWKFSLFYFKKYFFELFFLRSIFFSPCSTFSLPEALPHLPHFLKIVNNYKKKNLKEVSDDGMMRDDDVIGYLRLSSRGAPWSSA